MERIELTATVRNATGKGVARKLRREGLIPGIVYGQKTEPVSLAIGVSEFKRSVKAEGGGNAIINLSLKDSDQQGKVVMIRDMQLAPLTQDILHIDFQEINLKEEVEISVPLELVGKPAGVKDGGILQQIEREIELRCLPLAIPEKIEVDVSNLAIGDSMHVSDISVGEGFEILSAGDKAIAIVTSPVEEVEEGEAEEELEAAEEEAAEGESEE